MKPYLSYFPKDDHVHFKIAVQEVVNEPIQYGHAAIEGVLSSSWK